MSQVSRPVQIALVVVVLAGALWFLALRPHPPSGTGAQTPAPVATTPAPSSKAPGSSLPLGFGGLARAVDKAHGAVNTAQAQANTLQRDSGAASSPTGTPVTTATATASAPRAPAAGAATPPAATATGTHAATAPGAQTSTRAGSASAAKSAVPVTPAMKIKNELAAGKTVALLFWNPLATDDRAVYSALKALEKPHGSLVVTAATASQVTEYGTIVTAAQVIETPTVLLMRGKSVESITDLQDPSDLRQSVSDIDAGGPGETLTPRLASYPTGTTRAAYVARGNAVCARLIAQGHQQFGGVSGATATAQQTTGLLAYWRGWPTALAAIPAPPADRFYVRAMLTAMNRTVDELTAEIAAAQAGDPYRVHNLGLSAQANDDLANGMLMSYGLSSCVGSSNPSATP